MPSNRQGTAAFYQSKADAIRVAGNPHGYADQLQAVADGLRSGEITISEKGDRP